MSKLVSLYLSFRPFSESEAWGIFKIVAIGEAVGWTLLISGLLIGATLTPHNSIAVQIAGHLHGTLFLIYIVMTLVVSPSMSWKPLKILLAGLMSIPPYGSLLFELWQSHARQQLRRQYLLNAYLLNTAQSSLVKNKRLDNVRNNLT